MTGELEQAETAIYEAAKRLADKTAPKTGIEADALKTSAEALDNVALAVSRVKHGPQGGQTDYRYSSTYRTERGGAGFDRASR